MNNDLTSSTSQPDAEFIGWQNTSSGDPVALYNIIAEGHPSFGSTVTEESLHSLNLQVPNVPPDQTSAKKF